MWEESQAENTRLRLELSGVKSDLETARYQLDSAAKQARKIILIYLDCNHAYWTISPRMEFEALKLIKFMGGELRDFII